MLIQFCIELLVVLLGIYYFTIFLHFMGFSLYVKKAKAEAEKAPVAKKTTKKAPVVEKVKANDPNKKFEISLGKALIPFFYWYKRDTTV
jgi:hypothetical protein